MAGPVQTISYFARRLIQFEQKFSQHPPERLRVTAELFRAFSLGLDGYLEASETGTDVEIACTSLRLLLAGLERETFAEIGSPEADKLIHALREALEPGRLQEQVNLSENRAGMLQEIDKASILVRALADGLYVGV